MTFNTDTTAVIVVDMQNDFVHPDGELYAPPSEAAIEPCDTVIQQAVEQDVPIVFTKDKHTDDQFEDAVYYDEFDRWGEHAKKGTWGWEIVAALEPDENAAHVLEKPTYNAFHETELDEWLTERGIETVIICGTLANVCVLHTASGAALHDYRPVIVTDALGYLSEDDKEYAVDHAAWLFGETTTLDEVVFDK